MNEPNHTNTDDTGREPQTAGEWLEHDADPELTDKQRAYIHQTARFERALLDARTGDYVEATAQFGDVSGTITTIRPGIREQSGYAFILETANGEEADVTIDYSGAYTSHHPHYIPYIVAGSGGESFGDVEALSVRHDSPEHERVYVDEWKWIDTDGGELFFEGYDAEGKPVATRTFSFEETQAKIDGEWVTVERAARDAPTWSPDEALGDDR